MALDRLDRVARARREEPAARRTPVAGKLVHVDRPQDGAGCSAARPFSPVGDTRDLARRRAHRLTARRRAHRRVPRDGRSSGTSRARSTARSTECRKTSNGCCAASGEALNRYDPGRRCTSALATTERSRRRTRLRSTAPPTERPTAYDTNTPGAPPSCSTYRTVTGPDLPRRLVRRSASNVRRDVTGPVGRFPDATTRRSCRKPLATLQTTSPDDGPTRLRRHPLAEAMRLGTLAHVGLVGPLHRSRFLPQPPTPLPAHDGTCLHHQASRDRPVYPARQDDRLSAARRAMLGAITRCHLVGPLLPPPPTAPPTGRGVPFVI